MDSIPPAREPPSDRVSRGKSLRCAIYTRTSSEERLGQAFNSLDAQQEACTAYVASQREEGWVLADQKYSDGGFSGGTLDRPALSRLLADMRSGQIDLVVVYKIDRLTRSLADFARMMETFEDCSASFVSVTQHFSTTSSMGRLTLNVLLSFAQFEREVTGERIRDKVAASKRKGIWMGGKTPLGYDVIDRRLVINEPEAVLVRSIFNWYLETASVGGVTNRLQAIGARTKSRPAKDVKAAGGFPFRTTVVRNMLQHIVYTGAMPHRADSYPDSHEAIIPKAQFDEVQALLAENSMRRATRVDAKEPSLLAGRIVDGEGFLMAPVHTKKKGRRYRYYSNTKSRAHIDSDTCTTRLSIEATLLEGIVIDAIVRWLERNPAGGLLPRILQSSRQTIADLLSSVQGRKREVLFHLLDRVAVGPEHIGIFLAVPMQSSSGESEAHEATEESPSYVELRAPFDFKPYQLPYRLVVDQEWIEEARVRSTSPSLPTGNEIVLARAHDWWEKLISGRVRSVTALADAEDLPVEHVERELTRGLLAPMVVEAMIGHAGREIAPPLASEVSLSWDSQMQQYRASRSRTG